MLRTISYASLICFFSVTSSTWAQFGGPAQVEVEPVIRREVSPTIQLVGTLHPRMRSIVAADVEGLVVEMPFDYGAVVRKGDAVCILRDVTRRLAVDEAKAATDALEGELEARQADMKKTAFELERISRLAKLDRSSDKERVDAEANHAAAAARVRQSKAMLDEALAKLAVAEDNLNRTRVLAPFDGAITAKMTEVGQWVQVGEAAVEMVDLFTVRARVMVPESAVAFCDVGEAAMVTVDALGRDLEGKVSRVIPEADPQANTFPTDIDIPNSDGELKAGMFVRAMVPSGPKQSRLLVPKDAVLRRGTSSTVYVARGTAEAGFAADIAPVTVVAEVMQYLAVESPALKEGDRVIVRGNEGLRGPGPIIIVSGNQNPTATIDRDSSANVESGPGSSTNDIDADAAMDKTASRESSDGRQ
ncbi:MAG: efflux RND transporter periplasmic adaptor subunit [Phycisphaerales bacterium]|nr:efflux RND transporter periplasmic adaptor subunit [Phycisphaerales bacterium]MCB9854824.1 efflux RND transporter periplasmic adaptor subunit [Phycisphaerales bacterium]MCB9863704.1 efflux RND transporter periplasmic adaptor subunit [Phycisphaerales bacterium]